MKKYIFLLVALLSAVSSWADEFVTYNKVRYRVIGGTDVAVNHYYSNDDGNNPSGTVVIPASFSITKKVDEVDTEITYNVKGFEYWYNRYYWSYYNNHDIGIDVLDLSALTDMTDIDLYQIKTPITQLKLSTSVNNVTCTGVDDLIKVAEITLPQENVLYRADGVILSSDGKDLVYYPRNKQSSLYTIPDGVTTIKIGAFAQQGNIQKIIVPDDVTVIEDHAFRKCTRLAEINLPVNLETIGTEAFFECNSLHPANNLLEFPKKLERIGDQAFYHAFYDKDKITIEIPEECGLTYNNGASTGSCLAYGNRSISCNIIRSYMTKPGLGQTNESFEDVNKVYIPKGHYDDYLGTGWASVSNKFEMTSATDYDENIASPVISVSSLDQANNLLKVTITTEVEDGEIFYKPTDWSDDRDVTEWPQFDATTIPTIDITPNGSVLKAVVKKGGSYSNIAQKEFKWEDYSCKTPVFNYAEGSKTTTITNSTEGATVYYTSDGSDPSSSETRTEYTAGSEITLAGNITYKAIAMKSGVFNSTVVEITPYWFKCQNPTASYVPVTPNGDKVTVTLNTTEDGAKVTYNFGSGSFLDYTSPIEMNVNSYIYYRAEKTNYNNSDELSLYTDKDSKTCVKPGIAADPTTHMLTLTSDDDIYYTTDGSYPEIGSENTIKYTDPVEIKKNCHINAITHKEGKFQSSDVASTDINWFNCQNVDFEQVIVGGSPMMKLSLRDSSAVDWTDMVIYYKVNDYYWNENDWKNNGEVYTEPVPVPNGQTIYAVAIKDGYNMLSYDAKTMDYGTFPRCAMPEIVLNNETKTVSITTTETNGKIYYTIDGSYPTTNSILYDDNTMIPTDVNITIKAITARDPETVDDVTTEYINSDVASRNLDDWFRLEKVIFIPVIAYEDGETVYKMALKAEEGATIEYGINTQGGTPYNEKDTFVVNVNDYVYAIARKEGRVNSDWASIRVNTYGYTVVTPNVVRDEETNDLTITTTTDGADIYYTTDGTDPTTESTKLSGNKLTVTRNDSYKFMASKAGMYNSSVYSYNVNWFKVPNVVITPFAENNTMKVRLSCDDSNAKIYYGINDFESTYIDANTAYTEPFTIRDGQRVYASAIRDGYNNADRSYSGYIYYSSYTCNQPTITVAADTTVTISGQDGVTFYYTLDGTDPTTSSDKFTEKFKLKENTVIKAIAAASDKLTSSVSERSYNNFYCANVVAEQVFEDGQLKMKLTCATPGATIRYGVNGRDTYDPKNNEEYTEPVAMRSGSRIYYIAMKENFNNSAWNNTYIDYSGYTQCAQPAIYLNNETKTITMATSEENGKIYYTTNGKTPSIKDNLYSEPFTVDDNCIVKAVTARDAATIDGTLYTYVNSNEVERSLDDWFRLENVKFVPVLGATAGEYKLAMKAEAGTIIYYNINDGAYSQYENDTIAVNANDWVYAYATKEGLVDSYVSSIQIVDDNYTVSQPRVYPNSEKNEIVVVTSTEGAVIYYTMDGKDPTIESTKLTNDTLKVVQNDQFKFIAVKGDMLSSAIETFNVDWFRVPNVEIIVFAENNQLKAKLVCEDKAAKIYYGNNGFADPVNANAEYKEPIDIDSYETTIYASATRTGFNDAYRTDQYVYRNNYICGTPNITVAADTLVTISGEEGATFYYTLDGSEPTINSTKFTEKFKLTQNTTIRAFAVAENKLYSSINRNDYNGFYCANVIAEQVIDGGQLKMKLTSATPGATILYGRGWYGDEVYTEPIEARDGDWIYAKATKAKFNESGWTEKYMSFEGYTQCQQPSISLNDEKRTISLSTSEEKGKIYYTTNGKTPTIKDTLYTEPFTVEENCVIKAITARDAETIDDVLVTYVNSYAAETSLDDWYRLKNVEFIPVLGQAEGSYRLVLKAEEGAEIEYGIGEYGGTIYSENDTIDVNLGNYVYATARKEGSPDSYRSEFYVNKDNYTVNQPNIVTNNALRALIVTTGTDGASIYYTTDGKEPTAESTKLVGDTIFCSRNDNYKFIAIKDNMYNSVLNEYQVAWYVVPEVNIEPVIADNKISIKLTCDEKDATIYYAIGNEYNSGNVSANERYDGPFEINPGQSVHASAVKDGYTSAYWRDLDVMFDDYACSTPTIVIYDDASVSISAGTGEDVYYTLDGSDPTTSSTKYTQKFNLTGNVTVKAIAAATGKLNSNVNERSYSNFRVSDVQFNSYVSDNKVYVKLSTDTPDAVINYGIATGSYNSSLKPTLLYTEPIQIEDGKLIYAKATRDGYNESGQTNTGWLYMSQFTCNTPYIDITSETVTITVEDNSDIYYTLDGTDPTASSTKYSKAFKLDRNCTVKAIAIASDKINSSVNEMTYSNFQVATPVLKLDGTTMTITTTTENATIYYSVGSENEPSENANKYTGSFEISDNRIVKAIALRDGWKSSSVNSYTPYNAVQCPLVKQVSFDGHYMTLSTVEGATIYYRTDGQDPNTWNSSVYDGPIAINQVGTIKAKATHPYMTESDVASFEVNAYAGETGATTKEAGGLEASMVWADPETITEFAISGPVNSADMSYIKTKMTSLQTLDLSNAQAEDGIIPDNAFAGLPLITFSSPNALQSVGHNIFSGCKELAAVVWNTTAKIPNDAFDKDVNPNLLVFVPAEDAAPNNSSARNIIVNNTADHIYLSDGADNNFYSPKRFYTKSITYTHDFKLTTGSASGWETICLPFDCSYFVHESKGELKPFAEYDGLSDKGSYKPFWLRELTDIGFKDVKQIEANKPYIISMPNNSNYATRYRVGGKVTFSASNVYVPQTVPGSAEKGDVTLYANFMNSSETSDMLLLNTEASDDHEAGSIFVLNSGRAVRPFEAYVISRARSRAYISVGSLGGETDDEATAITERTIDDSDMVKVYNLSGVLVKQSTKEDALKGLAKGVYIVNGKRVMVK